MIEKTIYIADDGAEFDDEDACIRHEEKAMDFGCVRMFDEDMTELTVAQHGVEKMAEDAAYILIEDGDRALWALSYMYDRTGVCAMAALAERQLRAGAVFAYGYDSEDWTDLAGVASHVFGVLKRIDAATGRSFCDDLIASLGGGKA